MNFGSWAFLFLVHLWSQRNQSFARPSQTVSCPATTICVEK